MNWYQWFVLIRTELQVYRLKQTFTCAISTQELISREFFIVSKASASEEKMNNKQNSVEEQAVGILREKKAKSIEKDENSIILDVIVAGLIWFICRKWSITPSVAMLLNTIIAIISFYYALHAMFNPFVTSYISS